MADEGDPERKQMRYVLHFRDLRQTPLVLTGVKYVVNDPGTDLWRDTTTLATWVRREVGAADDQQDVDVATGILRLSALAFVRQLLTFRSAGHSGAAVVPRFAVFFLRQLWQVYGRRWDQVTTINPAPVFSGRSSAGK